MSVACDWERFRTHLWRNIVGCAAECFGCFVAHDVLLAHAKVGDFHVSVGVEQHVVQLQIAIEYALGVQIEQACCDLGGIEAVEAKQSLSIRCTLFVGSLRLSTYTATGSLNLPNCCI